MDNKQRKEEFLAKARQAEERALLTADQRAKEDWIRIAKEYRLLADELKGG